MFHDLDTYSKGNANKNKTLRKPVQEQGCQQERKEKGSGTLNVSFRNMLNMSQCVITENKYTCR